MPDELRVWLLLIVLQAGRTESDTHHLTLQVDKVKPLLHNTDADQQPGPGAYNPTETRTGKKLDLLSAPQSHNSAFKAGGHKLSFVANPDSPAPTKYALQDQWVGGGRTGGGGSKAGTSSFAGRSMGSLSSMPPMAFIMSEDGRTQTVKKDTRPGPGTYETQDYGSLKVALEKAAAKPSPAFQPPEFVDRFGQPTQPRAQPPDAPEYTLGSGAGGPQAHYGLTRASSPPKGVSAPFKSTSRGHADYDLRELARAPGPAYYSPKGPEGPKSFHLNARNKFVPALTSK